MSSNFAECFRDLHFQRRHCDVIKSQIITNVEVLMTTKNVDLPKLTCEKGRFQSNDEIPIFPDPHNVLDSSHNIRRAIGLKPFGFIVRMKIILILSFIFMFRILLP